VKARNIKIDQVLYGKRSAVKNIIGKQHYHNFYEVYFLEKGFCQYFIDDKIYEVHAGDVVLIPEGVIHKTVYKDTNHSRRLLYCAEACVPSELVAQLSSAAYLFRNEDISHKIRMIFDEIDEEYSGEDAFSEKVILGNVKLLFYHLARNAGKAIPHSAGNGYVAQTIDYIKKNFSGDIRLPLLAERSSVCPEHLSRIFKKETGFCISEYLTMIRLQNAAQLLRSQPNLSVSEIAARCGYNDSNYFSEQFKKYNGVSPLAYRKKPREVEKVAI